MSKCKQIKEVVNGHSNKQGAKTIRTLVNIETTISMVEVPIVT